MPSPTAGWRSHIAAWVQRGKRDGLTLWFAMRDARTPWPVKLLGAVVVAYALSPIDLIPDFIPVIGFLDELLLLPGLIWLALRGLPPQVLADCRVRSDDWIAHGQAKPRSRIGAALVIGLWLLALAGLAMLLA